MNDFTIAEAVAECAKWGSLMRALTKVQEVAQAASALEQNRAERQSAVDALGVAIESRKAELDALDQKIGDAKAQAADLIAEGQRNGASILTAAQNEAAGILTRTQSAVALAESQAADLRSQAVQSQQELDAARAALAAITQQIESAKADARARFT